MNSAWNVRHFDIFCDGVAWSYGWEKWRDFTMMEVMTLLALNEECQDEHWIFAELNAENSVKTAL